MENQTHQDLSAKKYGWRVGSRFLDWLDSLSESRRRIIQSVIAALIGAAIIGTVVWIWSQRATIAGGSKSVWNLLAYPFQLQAWIVILGLIGFVWIYHLFHKKNRRALQIQEADNRAAESKANTRKFIRERLSLHLKQIENELTILFNQNEDEFEEHVTGDKTPKTLIDEITNSIAKMTDKTDADLFESKIYEHDVSAPIYGENFVKKYKKHLEANLKEHAKRLKELIKKYE
jgi:hypothetical protein